MTRTYAACLHRNQTWSYLNHLVYRYRDLHYSWWTANQFVLALSTIRAHDKIECYCLNFSVLLTCTPPDRRGSGHLVESQSLSVSWKFFITFTFSRITYWNILRIYIYIYIYIYTHRHTHTHTHIYIHTYTYMLFTSLNQSRLCTADHAKLMWQFRHLNDQKPESRQV